MDFDAAAARLARDQSKVKGRRVVTLSDKAKKQAEFQKKQQERLRVERDRKRQIEQYQRQYMHQCERTLQEKAIGPARSSLLLQPTSIHGDGDKIALPPSVLETLTSSAREGDDMLGGGNPWTFRIGIPNPDYSFPASPLIQNLIPPKNDAGLDAKEHDTFSDDSDDEEHDDNGKEAYLDELALKYLVYTHGTVVEFTQEEGHVGVPKHIAAVLLDKKNRHENVRHIEIPTTRTVDPAAKSMVERMENDDDNVAMTETTIVTDGECTPGHLAWGAFDIPNIQLEITMVKLPKGRGCTLTPTQEAVRNNFYGLKDVKMVLEQSLIRTRATLSAGDVVSTWHRGVRFDLDVSKVIPTTFRAVTCINTDIEVDIGETESKTKENHANPQPHQDDNEASSGFRLGTGTALSSSSKTTASLPGPLKTIPLQSLLPEPPVEQEEGVCTVQIRHSGGGGKRRFAIHSARVKDLFAFAAAIVNQNEDSFRLVTRFPRRELKMVDARDKTLAEVGLQQGQEMFLIENL
ncbi:ubiquitin fusion degradation protein UFD1 [Nitzschia inconspicua]|uniref:Ubiquitin fusion degradation protein UFD1 n=1 Tax=Nitzschia inconspicua TaxID=303405 RepID=A0A9K3LMQ4_9STRA|nr:ubiquitin fusion degradation protein UFD1 [Nitzschia inconspicua]